MSSTKAASDASTRQRIGRVENRVHGAGMALGRQPPARSGSDESRRTQAYPRDSMAAVIHELVVALRAVAAEAPSGLPHAIEDGCERLRQIQRMEAARGDSASAALLDVCSLLLDVLDVLTKSIETSAMEAVRRERQRIVDVLTALEDEPAVGEPRPLVEGARQSGPLVARSTNSGPLAHPLTPQEQIVLGLLAQGAGTKDIAKALTISVTTAKKHVCNLMEKLDAPNRLKAVLRAQALGLLSPDSDQANRH